MDSTVHAEPVSRPPYASLPEQVRAAVERVLGSPVVAARTQPGGWSPGVAARVRCADGSGAFVKAVCSLVDPVTPQMHRAEARVTALLPASVGSPRLLGSYDDGTWVALVLEEVDGRLPELPWRPAELGAALRALDRLAVVPAPPGLPAVGEALGQDFAGWQRLAAAPPGDLSAWQARHLERLAELESGWARAAQGDRLLHLDVRADNLLVCPDGEAVLVDWPSCAVGDPLVDVVCFLPSAVLDGATDPDALLLRTAAGRAAPPPAVDAVLAAFCGRMEDHARRPPPPALPGVRAFQAAQARVGQAWLQQRTGWA